MLLVDTTPSALLSRLIADAPIMLSSAIRTDLASMFEAKMRAIATTYLAGTSYLFHQGDHHVPSDDSHRCLAVEAVASIEES